MHSIEEINDLVSVIVPVYNCDKYLNRTIDSILTQTYNNFEVILINDGSTDRSRQICEDYLLKDTRIRLINKNNQGVSVARNIGINNANGKYICFVDADDYIEKNMLEDCVNLIEINNADIICFNRRDIYNDYKIERIIYNNNMLKEDIINGIFNRRLPVAIWDKFYRKNLWNNVQFPNIKKSEDLFVLFDIIFRAKKIIATKSIYYNYNKQNLYSLTHVVKIELYYCNFIAFYNGIENAKKYRNNKLMNIAIKEAFNYGIKAYHLNIFLNYLDYTSNEKLKTFFDEYYQYIDLLTSKDKIYLFDYKIGGVIAKIKGLFYKIKFK